MKYFFLLVIIFLVPLVLLPQTRDSAIVQNKVTSIKPEILSGGFIDVIQNGQMNTSARLFRLFIGEPKKWQLPLSIYSGVSANSFSYSRENEDLVINLINPGLGIFNMSFDGLTRIIGNPEKITSLSLQYQVGFRFLSLYNSLLYRNKTFYNLINGLGLSLVTGAWEKSKAGNIGLFWINIRGLYSNSQASILKSFFAEPLSPDIFGYSVGLGIDITQTLAVRAFYFRFLNNLFVQVFNEPVLQLSFNYSFR